MCCRGKLCAVRYAMLCVILCFALLCSALHLITGAVAAHLFALNNKLLHREREGARARKREREYVGKRVTMLVLLYQINIVFWILIVFPVVVVRYLCFCAYFAHKYKCTHIHKAQIPPCPSKTWTKYSNTKTIFINKFRCLYLTCKNTFRQQLTPYPMEEAKRLLMYH